MIEITGRRETDTHPDHAGEEHLVLYRTFRADIDSVWRALTQSERMARWIGEWEGDPATGRVGFRMTAEGEDVSTEPHIIEACDPPHRGVGERPGLPVLVPGVSGVGAVG